MVIYTSLASFFYIYVCLPYPKSVTGTHARTRARTHNHAHISITRSLFSTTVNKRQTINSILGFHIQFPAALRDICELLV